MNGEETYFDPRYYETGLHTSEWAIQTDNGVMPILEDLENSKDYDFDMRNTWPVESYNRPTIPWSLECEEDYKTRKMGYDLMKT